ncbi:NAD(P)H-binding protein [Weissella viridescens]|uniref:NAD(P)H-binding protein n=1 Tax=Weissella viridescens TaxID=1629 RepID=UPI001747346E|nr:NAD(P)H-binding protein [Weissella viridescens]MBX4172492.1 NAD(P)H-binding protein [Weissella viridescens]MCB6839629.1 NAD(P)H-binding protein [Weissella viridescens]MCB6846360.1 NAD(P)H-binding protein [Weissella viridescens]QOD86709.1 NAD(P)H-binding protein [Weissella viridescens]
MTNIAILAAAGRIGKLVRANLINQTDVNVTLVARSAEQRLKIHDDDRETFVSTDLTDTKLVSDALKGQDIVVLAVAPHAELAEEIITAMHEAGVSRLIVTGVLGVDDEVPGAFGEWNESMIGGELPALKAGYKTLMNSDLNVTYLRMTWLYDDATELSYVITKPGEPLPGVQVTREAVSAFITEQIADGAQAYQNESIGIYEPGSEKFSKPTFY